MSIPWPSEMVEGVCSTAVSRTISLTLEPEILLDEKAPLIAPPDKIKRGLLVVFNTVKM